MIESLSYLFRDCKKICITAIDPELDLLQVKENYHITKGICIPSILQVSESTKLLRETDGVLLIIEAGKNKGKQIEAMLQFMEQQDISVKAALLVGGNQRLQQIYYGRNREER